MTQDQNQNAQAAAMDRAGEVTMNRRATDQAPAPALAGDAQPVRYGMMSTANGPTPEGFFERRKAVGDAQPVAWPAQGPTFEVFQTWKGYPLPAFNSDGQLDSEPLHREWKAFAAGRASITSPQPVAQVAKPSSIAAAFLERISNADPATRAELGRLAVCLAAVPAVAQDARPDDLRTVSVATLSMIYDAMNHMGDVLNNMDAVEDGDEEKTLPAFEVIRALLAAPPLPAVAPQEQSAKPIVGKVKRFDPHLFANNSSRMPQRVAAMGEQPDGSYVQYSDYVALSGRVHNEVPAVAPADDIEVTLSIALEALKYSKPMMDHYDSARDRHNKAIGAVSAILAAAKKGAQ